MTLSVRTLLRVLFFLRTKPDTAWRRHKAAGSQAYRKGDYVEAERQFTRALKQAESFAANDPRLAITLNNLGLIYRKQNRLGKAELFLRRALRVYTGRGISHRHAASILRNLAALHIAQGSPGQAKPLLKQAKAIARRAARNEPDQSATAQV